MIDNIGHYNDLLLEYISKLRERNLWIYKIFCGLLQILNDVYDSAFINQA
jgi:hypothetical protein